MSFGRREKKIRSGGAGGGRGEKREVRESGGEKNMKSTGCYLYELRSCSVRVRFSSAERTREMKDRESKAEIVGRSSGSRRKRRKETKMKGAKDKEEGRGRRRKKRSSRRNSSVIRMKKWQKEEVKKEIRRKRY